MPKRSLFSWLCNKAALVLVFMAFAPESYAISLTDVPLATPKPAWTATPTKTRTHTRTATRTATRTKTRTATVTKTATPSPTPTVCSSTAKSLVIEYADQASASSSAVSGVHAQYGASQHLLYPWRFRNAAMADMLHAQLVFVVDIVAQYCIDNAISSYSAVAGVVSVQINQTIPGEPPSPLSGSTTCSPAPPLAGEPNDALFNCQWNLKNTSVNEPAAAPEGEYVTRTLRGWNGGINPVQTPNHKGNYGTVTVAVLDTGVKLNHIEFQDRLLEGWNAVTQTLGDTDDTCGHGTQMASIIAAETEYSGTATGIGMAGINGGALILPIKISPLPGKACKSTDSATIASAIVYAADRGANIINVSYALPLSGANSDPNLANLSTDVNKAISCAHDMGAVVVASVIGNATTSNIGWPAYHPDTIAVTGSNVSGLWLSGFGSFSSWSLNLWQQNPPQPPGLLVTAPGENILAAGLQPDSGPGNWSFTAGYSPAAAQVSGMAALLESFRPCATNRQIEETIARTTYDLAAQKCIVHPLCGSPSGPACCHPNNLTLARQTGYDHYGAGMVHTDSTLACAADGTCLTTTGTIPNTCITELWPETPTNIKYNYSIGAASNDRGEVVGSGVLNALPGPFEGFYWKSYLSGAVTETFTVSSPIPLGTGTDVRVTDINNKGDIVLVAHISGNASPHSHIGHRCDTVTCSNPWVGEPVPPLVAGGTNWASAMNDGGEVVGTSDAKAFVYGSNQVLTDLNIILGQPYSSAASDINNQGFVVGSSGSMGFLYNHSGTGSGDLSQWLPAGQFITLPIPAGFTSAKPKAINDADSLSQLVIVGSAHKVFPTRPPEPYYKAVVWTWDESSQQFLAKILPDMPGTCPKDDAFAYGVNRRGQIVGEDACVVPTGGGITSKRALLWEFKSAGGAECPTSACWVMADLNLKLDAVSASNWFLYAANAIDNRGRIVGSGYYRESPAAPYALRAFYFQISVP